MLVSIVIKHHRLLSESGLLKAEPTHRYHMWSQILQVLNVLGYCHQDVVGPEAQVGRPVCCCVEQAGSTPEGACWPRLWPQRWLTPMEWSVARMFLCQALLPEGFYLEVPIGSLPAVLPVWPVERWPHLSCLSCTFLLGDPSSPFLLAVLTTAVTIWNVLIQSFSAPVTLSLVHPSAHDTFKVCDTCDRLPG